MTKSQVTKTEYRVRSVTRYIITKFVEETNGASSSQMGEFANIELADEIGRMLHASTPNSTFATIEERREPRMTFHAYTEREVNDLMGLVYPSKRKPLRLMDLADAARVYADSKGVADRDLVNTIFTSFLDGLNGGLDLAHNQIPLDFTSHRSAWRIAIKHAADSAVSIDDKSYWQHELNAFDKAFAALLNTSPDSEVKG